MATPDDVSRADAQPEIGDALRQLGPFDPPADYAFEPELCGEALRPFPTS